MYFSQKLKVIEEYRKWIEETKEETGVSMKDCYENFLAFLETKGYLKEENAQSTGEGKPRDKIELPCKIRSTNKRCFNFQIVYRGIGGLIRTNEFDDGPEADAFLADLKGGK